MEKENSIQKIWKKMSEARKKGDMKAFKALYGEWERASRKSSLRPENASDPYPDR